MRKNICIAFCLSLAASELTAQTNVGAAGAQFLKIGVGSRYLGMGETSVAQVNDVYSMYWNPAGLTAIENSAISFTNVNWILDINLNYVGYAKHFEGVGVIGVAVTVLTMGTQEITDFDNQNGNGQFFTARSYAVGLTYARQLTARFSFGATVKYVAEEIHLEDARGVGFDFGTMFYTGFNSLRIGMAISNIGPSMQFTGPDLDVEYDAREDDANSGIGASVKTTEFDLPLLFRFGLAYDFDMGSGSLVSVSAELKHPNDNVEQGGLGVEYGYNEQFFLRGGYKINSDEEKLSFGGGLLATLTGDTKLQIDYAWQDFGRLTSTQRFSLGFTF